jgi:predicted ATPase
LDLVIDRVPRLPVSLILTFRPEFAPAWIGRPHVTLLALNRLPPRERAEMIAGVTGGRALPEDIAHQIIDRTDGVPLFIEELTKSVVESGILVEAGDRYVATGPMALLAIPTTLQASLLARLDRLGTTREVVQVGAALGRQFSHELISGVAAIPQPDLNEALAQLVRAGLIYRRGAPPDAVYTFKHALVQDAAYGTLSGRRRQQLHVHITATLEGQFPEIVETQPELLARHCADAGLLEKAVGYSLKAGQQAIAQGAMTEAVAQLHKGLDLLFGVPDSGARQGQELDLQIALGHVLLATKGYAAPDPGVAYARARQLCEQLHRPAQLGSVLVGQYAFRFVRAELDQAERHAEEMRHLGEAQNDAMWKCFGSARSGTACCSLGKFIDSRAHYENFLSLWNPKYRAFASSPQDPYVSALIHLFRTLTCLGNVDQARFRRDEALAESRRWSPFTLAYARVNAWFSDWAIEGVKSAQAMLRPAEEVVAISREQGFPLLFAVGNIMRGWCLVAVGQPAKGVALILQGLALYRSTGASLMMPFFLMTLAEAYGMAGQPDDGLNRLAEAAKLVETTQEGWAEAEIYRLRGTTLLSMHEPAAAEDNYRHALIVARRQSAKFWELRAALDLAQLWRDQGKRSEARDLLAPVYGWFTEGFDTPVLQDAKALLDQLA